MSTDLLLDRLLAVHETMLSERDRANRLKTELDVVARKGVEQGDIICVAMDEKRQLTERIALLDARVATLTDHNSKAEKATHELYLAAEAIIGHGPSSRPRVTEDMRVRLAKACLGAFDYADQIPF